MAARCEACGREVQMPFDCKFCEGRYCDEHRLPEKHECHGLASHKERLREEGRLLQSPGKTVEVDRGGGGRGTGLRGRARDVFDALVNPLEGRAALTFLGIMVAVFFLEQIVFSVSPALFDALFVLGPRFYLKPWTIVTSIFAHGGFYHLFGNGIVLFFFGPTLEKLVGTRRFTALFLGAGVAAGLTQVVVFAYLLPLTGLAGSTAGVLGASGAIMGMLGALTLLAPNITVLLFFVVPAPLWLVTIGYAIYDLGGAVLSVVGAGEGNVAHLAHLAGLAIGVYYGRDWKDRGLAQRLRGGGGGGGLGGGGSRGGGTQVVRYTR